VSLLYIGVGQHKFTCRILYLLGPC